MQLKNSNQIKAELVGYKVLDLLKSADSKIMNQRVFEHAIYMHDGEDAFIRIIKDKHFIGPSSIVISGMDNLSFKSLVIIEGTKLKLLGDKITSTEGSFSLHIANAPVWKQPGLPEDTEIISLEEINLNLRVLKDIIYTAPSKEGLVPLLENVEKLGPLEVFAKEQKLTVSEKARPYIDALMWGIFSGDLNTIKRSTEPILGLGPGLTPSCDDFLAGLLMSLNIAGSIIFRNESETVKFFTNVSNEISSLAKVKTTLYSQSFISEASSGEGPKPAIDMVHSIVTESPQEVANKSKLIVSIGSTSGADMAIGIYYGIRFLTSRIELRDLNEFE